MTDAEALQRRIAELEAEIEHLCDMAVHMMSGICFGLAFDPEGLSEMADGMAAAGKDPDPAIARLAQGLEAKLREAAEKLAAEP